MTYPAPQPFQPPAFGDTPSPEVKRGWPGSAKVTAIVLAVTTLGAAGAGVALSSSAKSDTDSVKKDLAKVEADLDKSKDDVKKEKDATKEVQDELGRVKDDLSAAEKDRDAAKTQSDTLRALFPLDFLDFAGSDVAGTYTLDIVGAGECTGYADNDSACSAASLPTTLTMSGDSSSGYSVSTNFFAETPLEVEAGSFKASGSVDDNVADLCDGQVVDTAFTISIIVSELGLDSDDQLDPKKLFVTFTMGAQAASTCTATNRSVSFDGLPA